MRKPGQGVWNIVRFNWHFYATAAGAGLLLAGVASIGRPAWQPYLWALLLLLLTPVVVSLLVSWYVYDVSNLYTLDWLSGLPVPATGRIANIHAGFDETSPLLRQRFPHANLSVLDFYDPVRHTEVSIRRARAAYPSFPGTQQAHPEHLPLLTASTDLVCVLLAAHEIRHHHQRVAFCRELRRSLQPQGWIVVVEHLRDPANFLAYTIGFLHFYSRATWQNVFAEADLQVAEEKKITPFVSAFILCPAWNCNSGL